MKNTPGPWHIEMDHPNGDDTEYPMTVRSQEIPKSNQMADYRGSIVCSFKEAHGFREHALEEAEANARLIAAAPDLLEACQIASNLLWSTGMNGVARLVDAAIKKATAK